jgi:CBS domain-containing protein
MKVAEVMKKDVVTVEPNVTVDEASKIMRESGIRSLVVVDDGRVVGVVTDSDVVLRGLNRGDPTVIKVGEIMTKDPIVISSSADILEVVSIMRAKRFRRLPVVDEGQLKGIVSITDLAPHMFLYFKKVTSGS